jgi:hypothetical protein
MRVRGEFVGTDGMETVVILVAPTAIRAVYDNPDRPNERHEAAEYEFEGYLVGDYRDKIWVIGELSNNTPDERGRIDEITVYRLEPGEEMGIYKSQIIQADHAAT